MKLFTTILLFGIVSLLPAQNWVRMDTVFAPSGVGTFSFSAPFFADMNNDGYDDLFLGNLDDIAKFYFNTGENIPPIFEIDNSYLHDIYANGQQGTNSYYPIAVDLDNDGDNDLVIGGYNGLLYYENLGDDDTLRWNKIDTIFESANLLIGQDPKPAFADLDNDGDFDMFVGTGESFMGGPEPGIIIAFRNTGSPKVPVFEEDITLKPGIGDVGRNAYPTFADINGNGTIDLLVGRDLSTFVYYTNTGSDTVPAWTNNSWFFAFPEENTYWKNPHLFDIDRDNDFDLIYGSDGGRIFMYENTGDSAAASFAYNSAYFSLIQNAGGASTVSFADFDGDGDQDFISGNFYGDINYFENRGSAGEPVFRYTNAPFSNINVGSIYNNPVFVDLHNDGDYDIVSGALNGTLKCYVNNGSSFSENSSIFNGITVSGWSTCSFADIDGDGDPDLIMNGESAGDFKFYVNSGNNQFVEYPDLITGLTPPTRSAVRFADPDADGDYDLIFGRVFGQISFFENTGDATNPEFAENSDLFDGIEVLQNACADFADLNGDTKPDMIIGEYNGGFTMYQNNFAVTSMNSKHNLPGEFSLSQNYPNPFNPSTNIEFVSTINGQGSISVYDILGKLVNFEEVNISAGVNNYKFTGQNLASGIYIYRVSIFDNSGQLQYTSSQKMMLLK